MSYLDNPGELKKIWLSNVVLDFCFLLLFFFSKPILGVTYSRPLFGLCIGFFVGLTFFILNKWIFVIKNDSGYQWWLLINVIVFYFLFPIKEKREQFFLPYFIGLLTISTIMVSILLYKNHRKCEC